MEETKKRKRGKRGGKKDTETPLDMTLNNPNPTELEPMEKRKKTRRSKKKTDEQVVEENDLEFNQASHDHNEPELDHETRNYFLEIEKQLQKDFEDPEELSLFIGNVFEEVDGKELLLACDYEGSRVLEKLLKLSSDVQLRVFADRLNGSYYELVRHSFGSHVCQTLLNLGSIVVDKEVKGFDQPTEEDKKELPSMELIILGIATELEKDLIDGIYDSYASHVIRTLLNVLAGNALVQDSKMRSKKSAKYNQNHDNTWKDSQTRVVPSSFEKKLQQVIMVVVKGIEGKDVTELITHPVANPVVQILVSVPKIGPQLSSALLKHDNVEQKLIRDKVGSHLMEKLILNSNDAVFKQLYKDFFKPKLLEYTAHPVANFVVQKLIITCKKERYFKEILELLKPKIQDYLFRDNRAGIVIALLEAGVQHPSTQGELTAVILEAFGCTVQDTDIVKIILQMKSRSEFERRMNSHSPHLQGSLILQNLIKYAQPHCVPFITSVISLEFNEALLWIQDPVAARVVENVITNESTPNKLKKQLIESFYGSFIKLATDKYASRFVDKCWQAATLEVKEKIASELSKHKQALLNSFTGKFVYRNCHLDLFTRRKEEWLNYYKGMKKKKKETGDEIDDLFSNKI